MIRSIIINLLISFLKTGTIPTYQGISIAFLRYIAMQLPPLHDLIFMSYMLSLFLFLFLFFLIFWWPQWLFLFNSHLSSLGSFIVSTLGSFPHLRATLYF